MRKKSIFGFPKDFFLKIILIGIVSFMINPYDSQAQQVEKSVSGTVKGEEGEPLHNVTIFVERTSKNYFTDEEGNFTVDVI